MTIQIRTAIVVLLVIVALVAMITKEIVKGQADTKLCWAQRVNESTICRQIDIEAKLLEFELLAIKTELLWRNHEQRIVSTRGEWRGTVSSGKRTSGTAFAGR